MKNENSTKENYIIAFLIIAIILVAIKFVITFIPNNEKPKQENEKVPTKIEKTEPEKKEEVEEETKYKIPEGSTLGSFDKEDNNNFILKYSCNQKKNDKLYYELSDNIIVSLEFNKDIYSTNGSDNGIVVGAIKVNDKKFITFMSTCKNESDSLTTKISILGNSLIYSSGSTSNGTPIDIFNINNNTITNFDFKKLGIEKVYGMYVTGYSIKNNQLIVTGSRKGTSGIIYGESKKDIYGESYKIDCNDKTSKGKNNTISKIPRGTRTSATYIFNLKNSEINFKKPIITNEILIENFCNHYKK